MIRKNPICPRCNEKPKAEGKKHCKECSKVIAHEHYLRRCERSSSRPCKKCGKIGCALDDSYCAECRNKRQAERYWARKGMTRPQVNVENKPTKQERRRARVNRAKAKLREKKESAFAALVELSKQVDVKKVTK